MGKETNETNKTNENKHYAVLSLVQINSPLIWTLED